MAEQNPFAHLKAQPAAEPQRAAPTGPVGVVVPKEPEKPKEPAAGYEPDPNRPGSWRPIPGGPADPQVKGLTESESKAVGFYQRMRSAETQMKRMGMGPQDWSTLIQQRISPTFSRANLSDRQRTQLDLMENWIAASMRLESGAAIAPDEFEKQARIFFPQPGAGLEEQSVKDQQRELAILGFRAVAGPGAKEADANLRSLGFIDEAGKPIIPQVAETTGEGGQIAPKQAGELFQTDADIAVQRQIQAAWDRGASVDEIIQLNQQLGRGQLDPADVQRMRDARAKGVPMQFYATPTGTAGAVEEMLGTAASTAAGGYGIGAYNALTGGFAVPEEVKQYVEATSPVASTLGEITGTTLATIPAGRLVGALAPGLSATRAMLAGDVLVGGAQGAGASPEDMLRGTLYGAGGAALGGALANRFLPGGTGTWLGGESQAPRRLMAPDVTEGLAGAQQANIPVMTSDVRPPETFFGKSVQQAQERIPFAGTGVARATQQTARTTAVQELYSDYGITNARNLAPELADDILTRNQAIKTKYNNQKTEVINRLAGKGVVPVDNAVAELDKQIADLARRNTEEANEAIAVLQDHRAQLLQGRDLFQVEAFRKDTLAKAFDSDTMKPGTRDLGEAALRAVYPKLNDDMGAFIKIVGDSRDFNKWKVANKELSKAIEDAKVKSLQNAIKNGQATPELFENILFSARRSDVERLYNNMSPNGRSVARMAILNRVLEKSKAEGIEELTPDKFRSKLKDFADQVDVFFEGAEGERIKGLLAALNLTRRAGEAGVSTNTGQQLFYTALGTALTGGAAAIPTVGASAVVPMAVAGSLGLAGKIYESKPVRNLLMQISKAKTGAQQDSLIAKFWDVVGKQIPAGAGAVAGAQMAPEAEREGSIQITPGTLAP